jgi:hypothetical protein
MLAEAGGVSSSIQRQLSVQLGLSLAGIRGTTRQIRQGDELSLVFAYLTQTEGGGVMYAPSFPEHPAYDQLEVCKASSNFPKP